MIGGKASGLAFREGKAGHHFEDTNPFLVHQVKTDSSRESFIEYRRNKAQAKLLSQIYGEDRQYNSFNNAGYKVVEQETELDIESWRTWHSFLPTLDRVN